MLMRVRRIVAAVIVAAVTVAAVTVIVAVVTVAMTIVIMDMPVITGMLMSLSVFYRRLATPAEQIFHIMVMVLMGGIQPHVKIAHVKAGLFHPADRHGKSVHRQRAKRPLQRPATGSQIQKRRRRHVSADAGHAFQI